MKGPFPAFEGASAIEQIEELRDEYRERSQSRRREADEYRRSAIECDAAADRADQLVAQYELLLDAVSR